MNESDQQRLQKIIADILGLDESEVTGSFSYRDTDRWDSLKHMEIITAIEQNFSLTFMVDEIVNMTSIEDIIRIVDEKKTGE